MKCHCGCGAETRRVQRSSLQRGTTKGDEHRYLPGHNMKSRPTRLYASTMTPRGKRYHHQLRAERALGKPLPAGSVVHHADGSRNADAPLVICQDQAYHKLLHIRMRVVKAGGNPNTDKVCSRCRVAKPRSDFNVNRAYRVDQLDIYCRACAREKQTAYFAARNERHA